MPAKNLLRNIILVTSYPNVLIYNSFPSTIPKILEISVNLFDSFFNVVPNLTHITYGAVLKADLFKMAVCECHSRARAPPQDGGARGLARPELLVL